jgi:hypothetical protein
MTARQGAWRLVVWAGRWFEFGRYPSRAEAEQARDRRVEAGDNPKRLHVIGPFDTLPREPRGTADRPAFGWWTNAKFHGPG